MKVPLRFLQQSVILIVGAAMTATALFTSLPTSALLGLAAFAAFALASGCRLTRSLDVAILVIVSVIGFAYFLRYLIVVTDATSVYFLVPRVAWAAFDSSEVLTASLRYTTAALIAFCTSAMVFHASPQVLPSRRARSPTWSVPPVLVLTSAVAALVVADFLMVTFGIGRQGQFVESPLPFKLTGAIVYLKSVVIPCLFALCIHKAQKDGKTVRARATVALILCSAALDMALFSSRGALLNHVLFVTLIWLIAGFKVTKIDLLLASAAACAALVAIPVITLLRLYDVAVVPAVSLQQVYIGITFVMFRITGIDQLMIIVDLGSPLALENLWDVLSSARGIPGHYTAEILGVSESIPQTYAPSGLGWLYILGGGTAIVAGAALLAFLLVAAWKYVDALMPAFADVAKAFIVWQAIVVITEGAVGVVSTVLFVGLTTLWLGEQFLVRLRPARYTAVSPVAHLLSGTP